MTQIRKEHIEKLEGLFKEHLPSKWQLASIVFVGHCVPDKEVYWTLEARCISVRTQDNRKGYCGRWKRAASRYMHFRAENPVMVFDFACSHLENTFLGFGSFAQAEV